MKPKYSSLLWGLLFILIGAGYAGNAFGFWHFSIFFRGWWTLFIIVPCLASLIESGPSTGSVVGLIVGVLLLLGRQNILDGAFIGRLIIPIALVIIGLGIILSNSLHWGFKGKDRERYHNATGYQGNIDYSATFSGQTINCDNQAFDGANVDAVFGSVTLHLEEAIISHDVIINCNATFGGIDLYLPYDINVHINSTPIFGGVTNRKRNVVSPNAPTIFINATCMFGGVEIK